MVQQGSRQATAPCVALPPASVQSTTNGSIKLSRLKLVTRIENPLEGEPLYGEFNSEVQF